MGASGHDATLVTPGDARRDSLGALPVAPLYARVDGVETGSGFLLMELEVHEPSLFFWAAPEAARAFAEAIIRRL